ncbi:MAG: DHH family phosphoesterase [Planctomycetota bacterium]
MARKPSTKKQLGKLKKLAKGRKRALILLQDNPDPDAIASAAGLKLLLREIADCDTSIAHAGIIGRSENRRMLKYLGLNLRNADELTFDEYDLVAMVDTQPVFGNNPVEDQAEVDVVLDHHEWAESTRQVELSDIRANYGATSTIVGEYLREAGVELSMPMATALLYGIQSDTQEFGRATSDADIEMFTHLYPQANKRYLSRIENEQEPREYFTAVSRGLRDTRTYDNTAVCWLGRTINPDMTGEVADLLLRLEDADWVLCQGLFRGVVYISLRTTERGQDASSVAKEIVRDLGTAGGHEMLAGGQIKVSRDSFKRANKLRKQVERNFLDYFDIDPRCRRMLVSRATERQKDKTPKS